MAEKCIGPRRPYVAPAPGEEIVISGISGRFPSCRTVEELKQKLWNKEDLISDVPRWGVTDADVPNRVGQISDISKFDALFFGVHFKQAQAMDPMGRMLLEHSYEAIVDAGINPRQLRGKRVGVIVGTCHSESEKVWFYEQLNVTDGFGLVGCSKAMFANRISYCLGLHGPSYTVDTACSSSSVSLEQGYNLIRNGECEAVLVGGSNLCLHPYISLHFMRLGVLSKDGRCKCFDEEANGYARSDTVSVVLLQKAKDAKRIYTTIVHAKSNCDGFKEEGITYPSSKLQQQLLQDFYKEINMSPNIVSFLEAHGTGTKIGDPEEIRAIDEVYCKTRKEPLKIGSVKSNLGHAEPASGLCAVAKIIVAMENGWIPPNINYNNPRQALTPITEGRLQVIADPTPWHGGYIAANSFGFGGANAHVLFKSHTKEKVNNGRPNDDLPRLVCLSGRNEAAVEALIDATIKVGLDVEYIALLHEVHRMNIQGHLHRGYVIMRHDATQPSLKETQEYSSAKRPIVFVFSGMGSQWPGMGTALLRFPIFAKAIQKCDAVLKPRGIDIFHIITTTDPSIFNNVLHSFVGIAAIQIGLVDLLTTVGVVPDVVIGHSVGELGCAYADGSFTAEQMILAAYVRGLASIETKTIRGAMAAVGLCYQKIKELCPPDIDVACHNSATSSTISGPAESVKAFVAKLQSQDIFAREVASSNIAYHSRYIAEAGPKLLASLKEIVPNPKPRSNKWISTSIPSEKAHLPLAKYSSAEYHTNNLLSSVLFEESLPKLPRNGIAIEIAPHGLLQAIVKRALPPTVTNISITQRGHRDNTECFLQALGKLYNAGVQLDIPALYPPVSFPVSRGTPMIAPHIKWDHSNDWFVPLFSDDKRRSGERDITLSLSNELYRYMEGHVVDGRNLIPAAGYIVLVWETLARIHGATLNSFPVVVENVKFVRAATLPKDGGIELRIMIHRGTGSFTVTDQDTTLVSGVIRTVPQPEQFRVAKELLEEKNDEEILETADIYKAMKIRGYDYFGMFQGIKSASSNGCKAHIRWRNNYVTFLDMMLQLLILRNNKGLFVPTSIRRLVIDTPAHIAYAESLTDEDKCIPAFIYPEQDVSMAGGIEIQGLRATRISRKKHAGLPVLEEYKFVAHRDKGEVSQLQMVTLSCHLALEVQMMTTVKTIELVTKDDAITEENLVSPLFIRVFEDLPLIQPQAFVAAEPDTFSSLPPTVTALELAKFPVDGSIFIGTASNVLTKKRGDALQQLIKALKPNGFLLLQEDTVDNETYSYIEEHKLDVILEKTVEGRAVLLLKKKPKQQMTNKVVFISNDDLSWLEVVKEALKAENEKSTDTRLILVSQGDPETGLHGFVNCVRREPGGEIIKSMIIQDQNAPKFSLEDPFYVQQLNLNLPTNVLKGNSWGTYRHLPLPPLAPKLVKHAYLNQLVRGDMSTLAWLEGPLDRATSDDDLVHIAYAALNFRDVMIASGKITEDAVYHGESRNINLIGFEFSGVTKSGRRVAGLTQHTALANMTKMAKYLTYDVPADISLEDAATVVSVYITCVYALYMSANMKKGDKVLIHAGTGGIGQAAIHLALTEGCEVFTTVGTPEKRRIIKELFPSLRDDHIGNSRDTSFEQLVLQQTKGRGVDIVLNSLAEDKLLASTRCLAVRGRFLEIGKYDIMMNHTLGMEMFMKEISFTGIMLDRVMCANEETQKELHTRYIQLLKSGRIKPLTRTVFPKTDYENAFRFLAAGKHIGKVLIKIHDEDEDVNEPMFALPSFYCTPKTSYIVFGGLGGLGLEVADFLFTNYVDNLVLVSRGGIRTGYQKMKIEFWKKHGVNVLVIHGKDASKTEDCEYILRAAEKMGPVEGIFNLAVQLRDALCVNQTVEQFEESLRPKAKITKKLDELTRKLCPRLRHFVVFSSVSCGRGTPGQSNYGFANAVMERICERRVQEGLPGLAIEWGAVAEVGLVANMQEDHKEISIGGTLQQKVVSCMEELGKFLVQDRPIVSSMVVAEKSRSGAGANSPLEAVLNVMGIKDIKSVGVDTSLAEVGMDSMLAVEIKQTLERDFDIFLTANEIRTLTFAKLIEMTSDVGKQTKTEETVPHEEVHFGMYTENILKQMANQEIHLEDSIPLATMGTETNSHVFFIPGVEGSGAIFSELQKKIKSPATCLQFSYTYEDQNVWSLAKRLAPYILKKSKETPNITVVGYSMGSLIGIEIMRILEAEGVNPRFILLDGSPDYMKALVNETTIGDTGSTLLLKIAEHGQPDSVTHLAKELEKCETWEEKLDILMTVKSNNYEKTSVDYQKNVCTVMYKRILAVLDYYSGAPIKSPVTLVKPTSRAAREVDADYGLSKVTSGTITKLTVEGSHLTMLDHDTVAAVINQDSLENEEVKQTAIPKPEQPARPSESARLRT